MTYGYLTKKQKELHEKLRTAIDEDKDVSTMLQTEKSRNIKAVLAGHDYNIDLPVYGTIYYILNRNSYDNNTDLLFHAITSASGKTKSAESILTYIDSKSFKKEIYSTLATNLFDVCCAKDKENAKTIIAFAKENNILESLLKKHLNKDVAEEFFKKDDNHQHMHNNTSMISALEKYERNRDYTPKIGECAKFFVEIFAVIAITTICATPLIMLDPAFIALPLIGVVCMLSLAVVTVASEQYNIWSHKRDCNNDIIKGLQEQLKADQNLQQQTAAPTKEQEVGEEGKLSQGGNVSEMVVTQAAATGAIVDNALNK